MPLVLSGTNGISTNGTNWAIKTDSSGRVTMPYQPHIMGSPTNTGGSGDANSFYTATSRNLSWSNNRITVQISGVYLITFQTISSINTGRYDAGININGSTICSALNEDNGTGHHQKTLSISRILYANDYITFYNANWYDPGMTQYSVWRTASVTFIG